MQSGKGDRIEIIVKECLDVYWTGWFEEFQIDYPETGGTRITGIIADQSVLYGLLSRIRDLNLTLLSFKQTEA